MPSDMWVSLIAPSSGLVATILMLVPFALVLGLTLFSKNTWFSKLAWIFYVVFTSVLIFNISTGQFSLIYGIFLFCAVIMSIFDGTVRKFIRREQEKVHLAEGLNGLDVKLRNQLKQEIDDYYKIYNDPNTSEPDRKIALKKINSLKARYSKLGNF
jgi:ABC-type multidrug transport system fused ATPase/permease subunit